MGRPETRDTPLQFLPGVGPVRAEGLRRLGLVTVRDALYHFPRRYEDRRTLSSVRDVQPGDTVTLGGLLTRLAQRNLRGGRQVVTGVLQDDTGSIDLVWFNQAYIAEWLRPGVFIHAFGTVRRHRNALQIVAPEFEVDTGSDEVEGVPSLHLHRIVPVYQLTRGIHQRFLRRLVYVVLPIGIGAIEGAGRRPSPFDVFHPEGPTREDAFRNIHFPSTFSEVKAARKRFVFDEYFRFSSRVFFRRRTFREGRMPTFRATPDLDRKIRSVFPFELTADQDRVVEEVVHDLGGNSPMYRLLQGDVGTGKTAVALYAILVAVRNGYQGTIMAPTEILAEQHFRTVSNLLDQHPVRVGLLTGSTRPAARRQLLEGIATGGTHIVVGTHALIQDSVVFARLGLAVIDEQHRFGVKARQDMRKKGEYPHMLVMTATPIPRSLCMTCYGDLDLSILKERPSGRKPVSTRIVSGAKRAAAIDFVRKQLARGRQAYFVYPLIEESEALGLPAAVVGHRYLSEEVFPEFSVGLIHGKLSAEEKDEKLERFRKGEIDILVSTVVVEVGIDVPNASVLFIEDASRFGLAQLHQLRGRIGRGSHRSYCFVGLGAASREVRARLKVFAELDDGFRLAEEDLKLRGPGDFLGLRQSGSPNKVLGNPLQDLDEFLRVRGLAEKFWSRETNEGHRAEWREILEADGASGDFWGLD